MSVSAICATMRPLRIREVEPPASAAAAFLQIALQLPIRDVERGDESEQQPDQERRWRARTAARSNRCRSRRIAADFPDKARRSAATPQWAKSVPSAPAQIVSSSVSARNCRVSCQREAPSAARSAISLRRLVALTRRRFATFEQAMTRSSPTAPQSTEQQTAHILHHPLAQRREPKLDRIDFVAVVRVSVAGRSPRLPTCACSIETPSRRRAMTLQLCAVRDGVRRINRGGKPDIDALWKFHSRRQHADDGEAVILQPQRGSLETASVRLTNASRNRSSPPRPGFLRRRRRRGGREAVSRRGRGRNLPKPRKPSSGPVRSRRRLRPSQAL